MNAEVEVTKILSKREILNNEKSLVLTNSEYNLGEFIKNIAQEPNQYDSRFVFIK